MQTEHAPYWVSLCLLLFLFASHCTEAEKQSRGKGSWYKDRELLTLRGASWALALVCFSLSIVCVLS